MAKGRTYRVGAFINDGDGNHYALLEAETGSLEHGIKIPADWLAKGMREGDFIRATEEMPGVVRFREIANPPTDNTPTEPAPVTNTDEGEQYPLEEDPTGN